MTATKLKLHGQLNRANKAMSDLKEEIEKRLSAEQKLDD